MQRRTHVKQRRAECPLNVLQSYTRQFKTTSMITSKSFRNFRRHFLKINFRYNVSFLTSTTTYMIQTWNTVLSFSSSSTVVCHVYDPWKKGIWVKFSKMSLLFLCIHFVYTYNRDYVLWACHRSIRNLIYILC